LEISYTQKGGEKIRKIIKFFENKIKQVKKGDSYQQASKFKKKGDFNEKRSY